MFSAIPAIFDFLRSYGRVAKRLTLLVALLFIGLPGAFAQQGGAAANGEGLDSTLSRLLDIRSSVMAKRAEAEALKKALKTASAEEERAELQKELDDIPKSIERLTNSFEQLAIGGIDVSILADSEPAPFDWKKELEQITRPLLGSLRDLTEKPRKIEQMRSDLQRQEARLKVIRRAIDSIGVLKAAGPPPLVAERLDMLIEEWNQRKGDVEGTIEIIEVQIASLRGENQSLWQSFWQSLKEFLHGRGLTLGLALLSGVALWFVTRLIIHFVARLKRDQEPEREEARWERLVSYVYRIASAVVVTIGVVVVFYLRGDVVLLALTFLLIFMVLVSLRSALPRFVQEIRLLLDLGSVRVGERVVYQGVPMLVRNMHAFVTLSNPDLEGSFRLPLDQVADLVSRPVTSEPWFPCRPDEYVMLEDGRMARMMRQTVEFVDLKIMASIVRMPTVEFLQLKVRNLSRKMFGVPVIFGIDYRHQAICLDEVPHKLAQAVNDALAAAGHAEQLDDLLVEFKEAGANSLDYLIFLTMKGKAAEHYFSLARLVQRTCVEVCNREGWVIPFAQLTLHQGDGFDRPGNELPKPAG